MLRYTEREEFVHGNVCNIPGEFGLQEKLPDSSRKEVAELGHTHAH